MLKGFSYDTLSKISLEYEILKSFYFRYPVYQEGLLQRLQKKNLELSHIYKDYLAVPRETLKYQLEQEYFEKSIYANKNIFAATSYLRQKTADINTPRLLLLRLKRLLETINKIFKCITSYSSFVLAMDKIANPILSYIAWVFYVPRLLVNLFLLAKHCIPGSWMSEQEKTLPCSKRFELQVRRRGFELGNDFVWMSGGLINCFILVGALSGAAIYLTIALYSFDILLAAIKAYQETKVYKEVLRKSHGSSEVYIAHVKEYLSYEQKVTNLNLVTTVLMFGAMVITAPVVVGFSPYLLLAGVAATVAITIAKVIAQKYLDTTKPSQLPPISVNI